MHLPHLRSFALAAVTLVANATSTLAAPVITDAVTFHRIVGSAGTLIDFSTSFRPACFTNFTCVASSTTSFGVTEYTMRGWAYYDGFVVGSGGPSGASQWDPGMYYEAHLWNGPGSYLRPGLAGGEYLSLSRNRAVGSVGIHTTDGFYGWIYDSQGLESEDVFRLTLPKQVQITRLDFAFVNQHPAKVPTPGTLSLVLGAALAGFVISRKRNIPKQ